MDYLLNKLFQDQAGPFQGVTISLESEKLELARLLYVISVFLKDKGYLHDLLLNKDWHEHDGILLESKSITNNEFKSLITTNLEQELAELDDYVKLLIYNKNLDFILRVGRDVDLGDDKSFDITLSKINGDKLKQELEAKFPFKFKLNNSVVFFTENYAG